jgi:hypothetical protein
MMDSAMSSLKKTSSPQGRIALKHQLDAKVLSLMNKSPKKIVFDDSNLVTEIDENGNLLPGINADLLDTEMSCLHEEEDNEVT